MLKELDEIIEKNVKHYKTDWYEHDKPRIDEGDSFILAVRETGSDVLFLSGKSVGWGNLKWAEAWVEARNNKKFWLVEGGKIRRIKEVTVQKKLKELVDALPDEYAEYCKRAKLTDIPMSLADYKEYDEYCKKHWYRIPISDWLEQKYGIPY